MYKRKTSWIKYPAVKSTIVLLKFLLGHVHYWFSCHSAHSSGTLCYGTCQTEHTCRSFYTHYRWRRALHNPISHQFMWAINISLFAFLEDFSWNTHDEWYEWMVSSVQFCHSSVLWQCEACIVRLGALCLDNNFWRSALARNHAHRKFEDDERLFSMHKLIPVWALQIASKPLIYLLRV